MRVLSFSLHSISSPWNLNCVSFSINIMSRFADLNEQLSSLAIEEEENEAFVLEEEAEEEINKYELCVVGKFLAERNINVRAMKTRLADLWRPAMGINIKEIEQGVFLFQFYHKEDMNWVLRGGPWSFNNAMLVLVEVSMGEESLNVPLWYINMWLQIHDLPSGFMTELVGKQLGDFFGEFIEYDHKNNASLWREYMRIKVKLDVRKPLKRKKKIIRRNGSEVIVSCKYERLGDFCFTCGIMSHTERYCSKFLNREKDDVDKEWGSWLRAQPKKLASQAKSKFLREDGDTAWEERQGRVNGSMNLGDNRCVNSGSQLTQRRNLRAQLQISGCEIYPKIVENKLTSHKEDNVNLNYVNGPENDELIGLELADRKRMRGSPSMYEIMDTEGGFKAVIQKEKQTVQLDGELSKMDCSSSSKNELATLAQQASQHH